MSAIRGWDLERVAVTDKRRIVLLDSFPNADDSQRRIEGLRMAASDMIEANHLYWKRR